jgi:hypothetical protein
MRNQRKPVPFCASTRSTPCSVSTRGGKRSLLFPYGNHWATFHPVLLTAIGQSDYRMIHSGPCIDEPSHRAEASCAIVATRSVAPLANTVERGGFRRPARARLANSSQKLSRPVAGSPAEPARQHTSVGGVTTVAVRQSWLCNSSAATAVPRRLRHVGPGRAA